MIIYLRGKRTEFEDINRLNCDHSRPPKHELPCVFAELATLQSIRRGRSGIRKHRRPNRHAGISAVHCSRQDHFCEHISFTQHIKPSTSTRESDAMSALLQGPANWARPNEGSNAKQHWARTYWIRASILRSNMAGSARATKASCFRADEPAVQTKKPGSSASVGSRTRVRCCASEVAACCFSWRRAS